MAHDPANCSSRQQFLQHIIQINYVNLQWQLHAGLKPFHTRVPNKEGARKDGYHKTTLVIT